VKILIVALDNIGDVVMATSLVQALRDARPGAHISFWTKAYSAPILESCPGIDRIFTSNPFWEDSRLHRRGTLREFSRTVFSIRRESFDVALVLNSEWRRAAFLKMAAIPLRIGLNQRKSRFFLTHAVSVHKKDNISHHLLEDYRQVVESFLKNPVSPLIPHLEPSERQTVLMDSFFQAMDQTSPRVILGIQPFCGNPVRCWPSRQFIEFCERVLADSAVWIIGFCGPWERQELETWRSRLGPRLILPPETFTLSDNLALLAGCNAFVGLDSGLSHASAALGVPTIALFGSSNPNRFAPKGSVPVRILSRNPLRNLPCEDVLRELKSLLAAESVAPL